MKVFIFGGTGFLGYYAAKELLKRGHHICTLALPDIELGDWFPSEIEVKYQNVFKMKDEEIIQLLKDCDSIVWAIGPDDRFHPPPPAYDFFKEKLVDIPSRITSFARKAGVKKVIILNSYFAYFAEKNPDWKLAEHHPYIKARVEQAKSTIAAGGNGTDVIILQLPYIFGKMPGRIPLWRDTLLKDIIHRKTVMYPVGGSNMIKVEHVAEAIAGAIEKGMHGKKYLIGDENIDWFEMLNLIFKGIGIKRKIKPLPKFFAKLAAKQIEKNYKKQNKDSGLNLKYIFPDIQYRFLYYDPSESQNALGYSRGGVKESIIETGKACYPNGLE